jgi:hypothetical protein
MNTFEKSDEALTVSGDLHSIPWTDIQAKREFMLLLGLPIGDDDLPFEDTVSLGNFPNQLS